MTFLQSCKLTSYSLSREQQQQFAVMYAAQASFVASNDETKREQAMGGSGGLIAAMRM